MYQWLQETCVMVAVALLIVVVMCLICWAQFYARQKYWLHYNRRRSKRHYDTIFYGSLIENKGFDDDSDWSVLKEDGK